MRSQCSRTDRQSGLSQKAVQQVRLLLADLGGCPAKNVGVILLSVTRQGGHLIGVHLMWIRGAQSRYLAEQRPGHASAAQVLEERRGDRAQSTQSDPAQRVGSAGTRRNVLGILLRIHLLGSLSEDLLKLLRVGLRNHRLHPLRVRGIRALIIPLPRRHALGFLSAEKGAEFR